MSRMLPWETRSRSAVPLSEAGASPATDQGMTSVGRPHPVGTPVRTIVAPRTELAVLPAAPTTVASSERLKSPTVALFSAVRTSGDWLTPGPIHTSGQETPVGRLGPGYARAHRNRLGGSPADHRVHARPAVRSPHLGFADGPRRQPQSVAVS